MTCETVRRAWNDVDGRIDDAADRAEILDHLTVCRACRDYVRDANRIKAILRPKPPLDDSSESGPRDQP